jgi:hypothetical protein
MNMGVEVDIHAFSTLALSVGGWSAKATTVSIEQEAWWAAQFLWAVWRRENPLLQPRIEPRYLG